MHKTGGKIQNAYLCKCWHASSFSIPRVLGYLGFLDLVDSDYIVWLRVFLGILLVDSVDRDIFVDSESSLIQEDSWASWKLRGFHDHQKTRESLTKDNLSQQLV